VLLSGPLIVIGLLLASLLIGGGVALVFSLQGRGRRR
jgi:hypothetical protein